MASNSGNITTSSPNRLRRLTQLPLLDQQPANQLLQLPNEFLHQMFGYLASSAQLSLRHLSRELHDRTPPVQPPSMVGQQFLCERNALARANEDNSNLRSGKRRCVGCGQLARIDWFRTSQAPICKWHDGWLMKRSIPDTLEPEIQQKLRSLLSYLDCWISLERTYCAHTKDILNWHVKDCNCGCNFCGHFSVTCYVRVSPTNGQGLELDLVEGKKSLEMLERKRQSGTYGYVQERRLAVVPLSDL